MRLLVLCMMLAVLAGGCKGGADPQKKTGPVEQKTAVAADKKIYGMVTVVKKAVFDVNRSKTVGKVLDEYRYFTGREWRETTGKNKTSYVDFVGELDKELLDAEAKKENVVARSVDIKFVVKDDGTCFVGMITMFDTKNDGNSYPVQVTDVPGIMNAIYANAKLPSVSVSSDSPWRQTVIK